MNRRTEKHVQTGLFVMATLFVMGGLALFGLSFWGSTASGVHLPETNVEKLTNALPAANAHDARLDRLRKTRFSRSIAVQSAETVKANVQPLGTLIRVKGIMAFGGDAAQNEALIEDLRNRQVGSFKAGDTIKDVNAKVVKVVDEEVTFDYGGQTLRMRIDTGNTAEETLPVAKMPQPSSMAQAPNQTTPSTVPATPLKSILEEVNR